MTLPRVAVSYMDSTTGRAVKVGEYGMVYLTVAGVRVRASTHRIEGGDELNLVIDPNWTEASPANALDMIEVRATDSQAAIRVRGKDNR